MNKNYITYNDITKEILDTVKVGDLIKCNDFKTPLRVIGVSENYFIMVRKAFSSYIYSICEKNKVNHSRNSYHEGSFRIGTDNYVFGKFDYLDIKDVNEALIELENSEMELSVRTSVDLNSISIKRI